MGQGWKAIAATVLFLAFLFFVGIPGAGAVPKDDVAACLGGRGDAAAIFDACSRLLSSGRIPARSRATVYLARAQTWLRTRNYDQALSDYEQAILLDPANAGAHIGRGTIWWIRGENQHALSDFHKAIEIDPQLAVAYSYRGFVYRRLNNAILALVDCEQAIKLDPSQLSGYQCRAEALIDRGEADRALNDAETAIRIVPRNGPSYLARGRAWSMKGDQDRAISDFDIAATLNPQYAAAYAYRGLAYEKKGDAFRARADFETALKAEGVAAYDVKEARDIANEHLRLLDGVTAPRPEIANKPSSAAPAVAAVSTTASDKIVAPSGRRIALVIGNSQYRFAPVLANPSRDAATVADALRVVGFQDVKLVNDATRDLLVEALKSFANAADKADWAMIYYAGHGIEVGGTNYLIPVDARLASDRDVQYETVALDQVMEATEGAKKLHLVILDACRDNPFVNQIKRTVASRSIGRGLAQVEPDSGTLVVYAAKHGQTALDGDGANSPFVAAFARRIMTPQVEIRKLFDLVRDDVMSATGRRQQPFSYGSVPGSEDFFFVSTAKAGPQ
jgi:tetratricopeptide (TPR) repeat protein